MEIQSSNTNTHGAAPMPITMAAPSKRHPLKSPAAGAVAKDEMNPTLVYKPDPAKTFDYYCQEVDLCWSKAINGIIAMGFLICEARMNLAADEWRKLIAEHCPFDYTVACRLMQIAQSQRVTDPDTANRLPPSWDKLYQLMKLEQDVFQYGIENGIINPKMAGKDITNLKESWNKRQKASASAISENLEIDQISDTKFLKEENDADAETTAPAVAVALSSSSESRAPEATEASVKAPVNTSALRVVEKLSKPVTVPAKGRIAIILSREVADQNQEQVHELKERLDRMVKKYPFVEAVELEVAA